jgi:hypothetical protein
MRYVQSRFGRLGERLRNELPLDGMPDSVMDLAHAVLPPDDSSLQWDTLRPAVDRAVSILHKLPVANEIIREGDADRFSERFAHEMPAHEAAST